MKNKAIRWISQIASIVVFQLVAFDPFKEDTYTPNKNSMVKANNDSGATWVKETFDENTDRNVSIADVALLSDKVAYLVAGNHVLKV